MDLQHNPKTPSDVRSTEQSEARTHVREGAEGGSLDNITKSASARAFVDHETGEIFTEFDPTLKWQLQAVSRLALQGSKHRIRICMRNVRTDWNQVEVRQSEKSQRAYYAGLMVCGSVWACPVCAAKIQQVRTLEVRAALDAWQARADHQVVMLTQTVPHTQQDYLPDLLHGFTEALRKFKQPRAYVRAQKQFAIHGSIRALEVTHGANGWHPHAHTILFLKNETELNEIRSQLFPLWKSAATRAGLGEPSEKAFTVSDAGEVRNYITKLGSEYQWNAEHELVKSHTKSGRAGLTPFDMLRSYNAEPDDGKLLYLFAEYAHSFFGKRQLVWSNGLKKELLKTEGLEDEQIAQSIGEVDPVLASITLEQWRIIRKKGLQGTVLQMVQQFGSQALEYLIQF